MLSNLTTQLLVILIQLGVLLIMGALFNFLNKKAGSEKVVKYYGWVQKAVQAAEQLYGKGAGEEKKAWVLEYLTKVLGKKLPADTINLLLESAVNEMNQVLKQQGLGETIETSGQHPAMVNKTVSTTDTSQAPAADQPAQ